MFTRILLAALLAGVLSGVFVTAVQALKVTPLILEAEKYENGEMADGEPVAKPTEQTGQMEGHGEDHGGEMWSPENGLERTSYTLLANVLVGVSFSLLLIGGVLLTRSSLDFHSGLLWGVCGFVAFVLAPNFGLSPELPGMDAADLYERQYWWSATVVATAGALLIFAFKRKLPWMIGGLVLLVSPHIYGAPQPPGGEGIIPATLAAEFVVATIVTSLLFWLVLGGSLGWLIARTTKSQEA